jgi:TetR/AcrR family transcriptional regulator, transcriptional repressor for nem operon
MSHGTTRRSHPIRKQATLERIEHAIAELMQELGYGAADAADVPGGQRAAMRRVKALITLLGRMAPEWEQPGAPAHAPSKAAALSGALMLAAAVSDPRLSNALRAAALQHRTPDGA